MGTFDPAVFLDQTTSDANSTVSLPVPEGEYTAVIDKVDIRQWTGKKDPSQTGIAVDILWSIEDAAVKAALERDKVICRQGIMLDLNASGGIDTGKGKNVALGKLREATGLNTPGQPFAFRMLEGQMAKVSVKNRVDGDTVYSDVKAVTKLS